MPSPREHEHAGAVGEGGVDGRVQVAAVGGVEGVAPLGAVEADLVDRAVVALGADHAPIIPGAAGLRATTPHSPLAVSSARGAAPSGAQCGAEAQPGPTSSRPSSHGSMSSGSRSVGA